MKWIFVDQDAGKCRNLLVKPNTSHRTLHHLAGVRFRSPARAAAVVADVDPGVEVTPITSG